MINFVYGRDFSGNLLREYQEIVNRKIEAGAKSIAWCQSRYFNLTHAGSI